MIAARMSQAAIALLLSLPFLITEHTNPIPSFHAEWLAAILGLVACVALVGARQLSMPGAALLALALAGVGLLQAMLGRAPVRQLTSLFGLYLLWAALLACTSRYLAELLGMTRLVWLLATALLAGSLLVGAAALFQPWLALAGWPGYPVAYGGPLGQVNHLADYMWLGLASAVYLRTSCTLTRWSFWAAAALLALTAVFAGQRSSLLYAFALIAAHAWQARRAAAGERSEGLRLAFGVALLFLLMQPLPSVLPPSSDAMRPPPALRAIQQMLGPSVRFQLWHVGLKGIGAAPLLGNGLGSYPGMALEYAEEIPPDANPGPAEHAHNLPIDLGAELGVAAALMLVLGAAAWFRRLPQRAEPSQATWAGAIAGILALHSLIEYPLWHSYFLGLLALVAGAFGASRPIGWRLPSMVLVIAAVALGGLILADVRRDYRLLENALELGKQPATMPLAQASLLRIPPTSLLSPWVNTTACVSLDPLQVALGDGLAVCRTAMRFAPTIQSGVHMAVLQWRNGDKAGARELLHRLRRASYDNPEGIDSLLAKLAARDLRIGEL